MGVFYARFRDSCRVCGAASPQIVEFWGHRVLGGSGSKTAGEASAGLAMRTPTQHHWPSDSL
jgi:hypothetical protein